MILILITGCNKNHGQKTVGGRPAADTTGDRGDEGAVSPEHLQAAPGPRDGHKDIYGE